MQDREVAAQDREVAAQDREVEDRPPLTAEVDGASAGPGLSRLVNTLLEDRGWPLLKLASDALLLTVGILAALAGAPADLGSDGRFLVWLFPPLTLALLAARKSYRARFQVQIFEGVGGTVGAMSVVASFLVAVAAWSKPDSDPAQLMSRAWVFSTVYVIAGRILLAIVQRRARTEGLIARRTLVVGAGQVGAQVERRLREQPQLGLRLAGFLDGDPPPEEMVPGREAPVLGGPGDLPRILEEERIEHVVLAFTNEPDSSLYPVIRHCEARGVEVTLVPRLFEGVNMQVKLEHIGGLPLFGLRSVDPRGWRFSLKHGMDRVVAGFLLLLLSPVLLIAAVLVRLSSPGPVLFRQLRMGRDGRPFEMLKFRSMRPLDPRAKLPDEWIVAGRDTAPGGIEGDDRRSRVGKFLRATSLDELPQLINVAKGEMSLVGPRPERPEFVELFEEQVDRYGDRVRVKAGMTGWAQVHGLRGKTSLTDRVEWDLYYIENWSLGLDLKILAMTFGTLFHRAE